MNDTLIDRRYLLLEVIGAGGEARVFRARDIMTGEYVAARLALRPVTYRAPKRIPPAHAGWVRFMHWGVDPEYGAYQIFELLHGTTLHQTISSAPLGPLPWRSFVDQSLDAVDALHDSGWIHGDLNADNFIDASVSRWKLLELPFLLFDPPPDRSTLFGSIHTLAPEQLNGSPASFAADLYSLGCLYYYAACGEFPHTGASGQQIAIERLRFDPIPLKEKSPKLRAAWCDWVMKLLARDPLERFPAVSTARDMLGVA